MTLGLQLLHVLRACRWIFAGVFLFAGAYLLWLLAEELLTGHGSFSGNHYDFLAFYSAAHLTLGGNIGQIFDATTLNNFQRTIVPTPTGAAGYMPFLNPPFVAVLLAPLALLAITPARVAWLAISLVIIVAAGWLLTKPLSLKERIVAVALLATTVSAYQAYIEGQVSFVLVLGGALAWWFASRNRPIAAGASLALLMIKPQFAVLAGIGLLVLKQWKIVAAMVATTLVVAIAALPITGFGMYATYVQYLLGVTAAHVTGAGAIAPTVWQGALDLVEGINGFFTALFGQTQVSVVNIITAVTALAMVVLLAFATREVAKNGTPANRMWVAAAAIVLGILLDPHLFVQDVMMLYLVLPLFWRTKWFMEALLVVVGMCDFVMLDQRTSFHIAALCLMLFVVFVCSRVVLFGRRARA